jgi:hypothetical protein
MHDSRRLRDDSAMRSYSPGTMRPARSGCLISESGVNYQPREPNSDSWQSVRSQRNYSPIVFVSFIVLMVLGLVWLVVAVKERNDLLYAEFMSGCEQDHKHYECMLLWRASRRDDVTVVSTPIVVPTVR